MRISGEKLKEPAAKCDRIDGDALIQRGRSKAREWARRASGYRREPRRGGPKVGTSLIVLVPDQKALRWEKGGRGVGNVERAIKRRHG